MSFANVFEIMAAVRGRVSDHQAILYTLNKYHDRFQSHPELIDAINRGDVRFVRNWFKIDLDDLSLPELRQEARLSGVYPVYGKSKTELIIAIMEKRDV